MLVCLFQGNSPQAKTIAGTLSQKLQQLKNLMQDALVNQVSTWHATAEHVNQIWSNNIPSILAWILLTWNTD